MQLIVFSFSYSDLLIKLFGKTPGMSPRNCDGKWLGVRKLLVYVSS